MGVNEFVHSTDLLPPVCAAVGMSLPEDRFDGIGLLPVLTGDVDAIDRPTTFWQIDLYKHLQRHYPKPEPYATEIAREGCWKMLARDGVPVELFDIESDPNETTNLLQQQPEIAHSLQKQLQDWLAERRQPFGKID